MSIFNIDYTKLAVQLLPSRLRLPGMKAFALVLIAPVRSLYGRFQGFRDDALYELRHNGQVCHLEGALNDMFDNTARRIYIEDGDTIDAITLFIEEEEKPVALYVESEASPVYFYTDEELTTGGSFVVKVPDILAFDPNRMRALVNKYKLAGKLYEIQTF